MTLILEFVHNYFFVSVSDRLTTASGRPHDTKFNKSIYCFNKDYYICISFTGLAFINDMPTDDWLASLVLRDEFSGHAFVSRSAPMIPSSLNELKNLIVIGLKHELEKNAELRKHALEIRFTGLEAIRRIWVQSNLVIRKPEHSEKIHFEKLNGWLAGKNLRANLLVSGGWHDAGKEIIAKFGQDFGKHDEGVRIDEYVEERLIDTLRKFAERFPEIGAHAMATRTWLRDYETTISFKPDGDYPLEPVFGDMFGLEEAAHSPWIIAPSSSYPPIKFVGQPSLKIKGPNGLGGLHVIEIKGVPPNPGGFSGLAFETRERRR
ncbi:MAG: hypothetical protein GY807_00035 [Gammaproteobacteria bacterium]|nr:hypothetical protein [Gammaproteobacteria bacterium]